MPRYLALCDVVLNKPTGAPDLVKAGDTREFETEPFQGRYQKWELLDGAAVPAPVVETKPRKKSPTDIDKPYTGVRALPTEAV
jgi:hypothetical protein